MSPRNVEEQRYARPGLVDIEADLTWSVRKKSRPNCENLTRLVCWLLVSSLVRIEAWRRSVENAEYPDALTGRTNCSSCLDHDVRQMMSSQLMQRKVFEHTAPVGPELVGRWHEKTRKRG
jgi:hypothetical protein